MSTVVKARNEAPETRFAGKWPLQVKLLGGLPPFPSERFTLAPEPDAPPFLRLVADEADLAFHVLEPFLVDERYAPEIRDEDWAELGLRPDDKPLILCVVNLSRGAADATVNLAGPLVFNLRTGRGKQVSLAKQLIPLNAAEYSARRRLAPEQA